jgi:primary-amine oxidase
MFPECSPNDPRYAHPIESLRPVVDLNTMKVIRVEEYSPAHYPLPPEQGNYAASRIQKFREGIKPIQVTECSLN